MDNLFTPAVVLILWTLLMLFMVAATRLPAATKAGLKMDGMRGGRGVDIDPQMPDRVAWISHNYTHLVEQPTLFYATIAILAIQGAHTELNIALAWLYVVLRILHSLWQVFVNTIPIRFGLFVLATLSLVGLAINALRVSL
ncbi:MAG: MAPEG family protein [Pseudomonadales bacterium]